MFSMVLVGPDPYHLIRIRIQGNVTDSMDPDPPHCYWPSVLYNKCVIERVCEWPSVLLTQCFFLYNESVIDWVCDWPIVCSFYTTSVWMTEFLIDLVCVLFLQRMCD